MTKPTKPRTGIAGKFFTDDRQVGAHESAVDGAQKYAQGISTEIATEVAVAVRKVLSNYRDLSREKLVSEVAALVLKRTYASLFDHQYEHSFIWELDSIIREERRQKAMVRKRAKEQERLAAWRQEYAEVNAMLDMDRGIEQ